jgi:hypothetical protein
MVYVSVQFFQRVAARKIEKVYNLLYDCDFESYVAFFEKAANQHWSRSMKNFIFINLAGGYLFMGKNQEALSALGNVGKFTNSKSEVDCRLAYHRNWFSYHCRVQADIPAAEASMAELHSILNSSKLNDARKTSIESLLVRIQCLLRMEQGDFSGCEAVFLPHFEEAEQTW